MVSSTLAACADAEHLPVFLPLALSGVFFFIFSVIVHVPEALRGDGVTVASKRSSLSLFDAVFELDLDCVFESDELAKVFGFSLLLPCFCCVWLLTSCCR